MKRLLLAIVLSLYFKVASSDVVVINNSLLGHNKMHMFEIQSIFLLRKTFWYDGSHIVPIFLPDDSPVHTQFVSKILHISPYNFNNVVNTKIQNGEAPHIIVAESPEEAISYVKKILGAIAYISGNQSIAYDPSISVIEVVD